MRVLHVLNYAWPMIDGYTVRSIGLITAQKKHLGYDAPIAVSPFPPLAKGRDEGFITDCWGPDHQIKAAPFDGRAQPRAVLSWERPAVGLSPSTSAHFHRELHSIVRRIQPDLIHCHHPHYVAATAMRVARDCGLPAVYELRCINGDYDLDTPHPYYRARGHWQNALEYALAREASATVTISDGLAQRLVRHGVSRDRLHVVRNSVNTDLFTPAPGSPAPGSPLSAGPHQADAEPAPLRVGYATTFEAMENLDGAVRAAGIAAEALAGSGRRLEMTLAGAGRDWDRIRGLVDELGLSGVVKLPGFVPYSEMPAFYRSLDLFLVPRKPAAVSQDTTPLKPLEALACGKPLLATDLPAMRELLAGREDVRFVGPDPEPMARAIVEFAETPWPGGDGIPERAWATEVRRYEQVYADAQHHGPPRPGPARRSAALARAATGRTHAAARESARSVKLAAQRQGLLRPLGAQPLKAHLVVCGFPRAGSTLLQVIARSCVADVDTYPGEVEGLWAARHINHNRRFMLTKRPADIDRIPELRAVYAQEAPTLRLILTVRDPRAVLTSRHQAYTRSKGYYVSPERWREVRAKVREFQGDDDVLVLRYEDLVRDPERVQQRLTEFVGWSVTHPFADYHHAAAAGSRDSMTEGALGGLRPLDPSTLDRWRDPEHHDRLRAMLAQLPELTDACIEMGYEPDDAWAEDYRQAPQRVTP